MRNAVFRSLLAGLLLAACGGDASPPGDSSGDATTCTGTQPLCEGCCGITYAAYRCVNGNWMCGTLNVDCLSCDAATDGSLGDGLREAGADAGTDAPVFDASRDSSGDASVDAAGCPGMPPLICDAGTDGAVDGAADDAATCTGTSPWCFGNDVTHCCGQDPAGPAVCVGSTWTCGSAPAPGCNGVSCLLQDAASD